MYSPLFISCSLKTCACVLKFKEKGRRYDQYNDRKVTIATTLFLQAYFACYCQVNPFENATVDTTI
jgi:hypothetical protein